MAKDKSFKKRLSRATWWFWIGGAWTGIGLDSLIGPLQRAWLSWTVFVVGVLLGIWALVLENELVDHVKALNASNEALREHVDQPEDEKEN